MSIWCIFFSSLLSLMPYKIMHNNLYEQEPFEIYEGEKKKRERERRCVKGEIKKTYRFSWFSHHRPIPYLSTVSYKHPYLLHRPFRDPCSQVTAMKEAEKVLNISKQEMRWETEIQNEKSKSKYGKSYQHISLYKPGSNFIECFVDFL